MHQEKSPPSTLPKRNVEELLSKHDISTPALTRRGTGSSINRSKKDQFSPGENEYEIAKELGGNSKYCKFTAKQRRGWRHLDKDTIKHLYSVIDCAVKNVGSKPLVINDDEVQETLSQMKLKLKAKLHTVKAPNKKTSSITNTNAKIISLREKAEQIRLQTCEIEQEIRQEERKIESLEGVTEDSFSSGQNLCIKVPKNELQLPPLMLPNT